MWINYDRSELKIFKSTGSKSQISSRSLDLQIGMGKKQRNISVSVCVCVFFPHLAGSMNESTQQKKTSTCVLDLFLFLTFFNPALADTSIFACLFPFVFFCFFCSCRFSFGSHVGPKQRLHFLLFLLLLIM